MADQIATNTFEGGMNLDLNPLIAPDNTLSDALNATMLTFNGLDNTFQNDMGNASVLYNNGSKTEEVSLSEGFIPVGSCELGGVLYIASHNPFTGEGEIGSYPSAVPETQDCSVNIDFELKDLFSKGMITIDTGIVLFPGDSLVKFESEQSELIKELLDYGILTIDFIVKSNSGEELAFKDYSITSSEIYDNLEEKSFYNKLQSNLYVKYTIDKLKLISFKYYYLNNSIYIYYNTPAYVKYGQIVIISDGITYQLNKFPDCTVTSNDGVIKLSNIYTSKAKTIQIGFNTISVNDISLDYDLTYDVVFDKTEASLTKNINYAPIDYQYYVLDNCIFFKYQIQAFNNTLLPRITPIIVGGKSSGYTYYKYDSSKGLISSNYSDSDKITSNISQSNNAGVIQFGNLTRPFLYTKLYNDYFDEDSLQDFINLNLNQSLITEVVNTYTSFDTDIIESYQHALNIYNNESKKDEFGEDYDNIENCNVTITDNYVVNCESSLDSDELPYSSTFNIKEGSTEEVIDNNEFSVSETQSLELQFNSEEYNDNSILTLSNIAPCSKTLYNLFYPGILFPTIFSLHRDAGANDRHGFGLYLCPFYQDSDNEYKHYFRIGDDVLLSKTIKSGDDANNYGDSKGRLCNHLPQGSEEIVGFSEKGSDSKITYVIKDYEDKINSVIANNPQYSFFIMGDPTDFTRPRYVESNDSNPYAESNNDFRSIIASPAYEEQTKDYNQWLSALEETYKLYYYLCDDNDFDTSGKLKLDTKYQKGDFEKFTYNKLTYYYICIYGGLDHTNSVKTLNKFSSTYTTAKSVYEILSNSGVLNNTITSYSGEENDSDTTIYSELDNPKNGSSDDDKYNGRRYVAVYGETGSGKLPGKKVNNNDISGPWNYVEVWNNGKLSKNESCLALLRDSSGTFTIPYFSTEIWRSKPAWGRIIGMAILCGATSLLAPGIGMAIGCGANGVFLTLLGTAAELSSIGSAIAIKYDSAGATVKKLNEALTSGNVKSFKRGFKKYKMYGYNSFFSGNTIDLTIINQVDEYENRFCEAGYPLSMWERKCHYIAESLGLLGLTYYLSSDDDLNSINLPNLVNSETLTFLKNNEITLYGENEDYQDFVNLTEESNNIVCQRFKNHYLTNIDLSNPVKTYKLESKTFDSSDCQTKVNDISLNIKDQIACVAVFDNYDDNSTKQYFITDNEGNYLSTDQVYDFCSELNINGLYEIALNVLNDLSVDDNNKCDVIKNKIDSAYPKANYKEYIKEFYKEYVTPSDTFSIIELNGKNVLIPNDLNYNTSGVSNTVGCEVHAKHSTIFQMKDYTSWIKLS